MSMLIGTRIRSLFALLLVAAIVTGNLVVPTAAAAQGQSVQSQLTGVAITYGPPYVLQADLGYADENLEMITFLGAADMLSVGFMSPLIDLNGARDIMLEALFGEGIQSAGIDRGDYTGVSYSLDMMNVDGSEMGVFSLFMNNRSHGYAEFYIFIAPPALFASTMQTAQNTFTIGGTPLMDGVDSTVMGNMITANIGVTGGTAVTNVTDVAGQTTSAQPTPPAQTTQTTQTTQPDANARATYLAAVQAEFETANTALTDFVGAFDALTQQTSTADEVRPIINSTMQTLAGTSQRASAIQPPAGMEAFHQEFLAWAQAMTNVGVAWENFNNGAATADDHRIALLDAIEAHTAFATTLDGELNASTQAPAEPTAAAQPTQVAQPTQAAQPTQTTQTSTTDPNARTAYLKAVEAEFLTANQALTDFGTSMEALGAETTTIEEARPIVNGAMETLAGTSDRAAAIQPPAGMESFHAEFLAWAAAMTNVGVVWADFVAGTATSEEHSAAFSDAVEIHNTFTDLMVAELQAPTADTPVEPTQAAQPTQATTTTATDADARSTYLAAVQAEYDAVTAELATILGTLEAMSNESMPAADAVPILDASHQLLAGTSDRIAAIQPPAGMEAFHQEFVAWGQSMTDLGLGWAEGVASGNLDAYNPLFNAALESHTNFAISLETELANTGGQATETTPEPATTTTTTSTRTTRTTRATTAETPVPTETTATTTTGTTVDGRAEYLQAVRAEYDYVDEQVVLILEALEGLENETLTAEEAVAQMTTANAELSAASQRIQGLQPPAGMEAFHGQFLEWNEAVVTTGDTWLQFANQQVEVDAYIDALNVLVPLHTGFGATLETEEAGAASSTTAQTGETPAATEASGTTRTTRTTRSTTTTPQGNTSETSGTANTAGTTSATTGENEWLMPENGVTITWSEPFVPNESDGSATESDPATGEDSIRLIWESATGTTSRITVSVSPSDGGDASGIVSMLEADETAAAELFGEGSVLVTSVNDPNASAALIQLNIPQADLWIFVQTTCLEPTCGTTAMVLIVSGPENLPLLLADMEQGVTIDGVVISNAIPIADIENSLSTPGN